MPDKKIKSKDKSLKLYINKDLGSVCSLLKNAGRVKDLEYGLVQDIGCPDYIVSLVRTTKHDEETQLIYLNRASAKWLLKSLKKFAETGLLV